MDQVLIDMEAEDEMRRQGELDYQRALQLSLEESNARRAGPSKGPTSEDEHAGSSSAPGGRDIDCLSQEIEEVEAQVVQLQNLLKALRKEKDELVRQQQIERATARHSRNDADGKGKAGIIDYNSDFEWSGALYAKLKSVFGFDSFRSCQEGICNANMDGRDIVAIMPTGGGKSLGYQLPALMVPGCTLVISPLLALISDQIMHLQEAGIDAVMLTTATPRAESGEIYKRLHAMASGDANVRNIKLCYITPEKIAKSKVLKHTLDKLYRAHKLARFVVDEAHCVSSEGHDFRPDYQKLSVLRQFWPDVPILAMSATCPAAVLADVISTLRMPSLTTATRAEEKGTVLFSTSLYRKNLHYSVLSKPSGATESISAIRDYILTKHRHDTGIIYCLAKKDAESVAEALMTLSDGEIKTGVYHADVPDARKEALHRKWREGEVKVVCATIAFGMGIDKGDVRFVIHHTLSKSMDGFYQESGRAGRDGKDADCVLYYRPQDATRIATLTCDERGGQEKVLAMLAFASDLEECRKKQFANYFNKSAKLSFSSWTTEKEDAHTRCGHCDNCTRPPEMLERPGVPTRVAAWQILRAAEAATKDVTLAQLCDLARGLASAAAASNDGHPGKGKGKGKGKAKEKATVDVNKIAGGKVMFSKEQTEAICVRLLVEGYLKMSFQPTAYTINVYLKPSTLGARFTRLSKEDVEQGKGPAFDCVFLKKVGRRGVSGAGAVKKVEKAKGTGTSTSTSVPRGAAGSSNGTRGKRSRVESLSSSTEDEVRVVELGAFEDIEMDSSDSLDEAEWQPSMRGKRLKSKPQSMGDTPPPGKKPRKSGGAAPVPVVSSLPKSRWNDDDTIVLSD